MSSLARISGRFDQACASIDRRIAYALKLDASDALIAGSIISFCVIKLHDQWNARCRELIIKSAMGNHRTLTGTILPKSIPINPLQQLRKSWARRPMSNTWEPDWHVPAVSDRAARLLGISNYNTVSNAITALTIIDELRWARNAITHELPHTYQTFRNIQSVRFIPPSYCPSDYAVQRIQGSPDLIIDLWMTELKLALRAAIR